MTARKKSPTEQRRCGERGHTPKPWTVQTTPSGKCLARCQSCDAPFEFPKGKKFNVPSA